MSIMIYGLEMPKDGEWYEINIFSNGEVCRTNWQGDQTLIKGVTAVQIPPHGDLIDKKTVTENLAQVLNNGKPPVYYPNWNDAVLAVFTAPTIIPASEEVYDKYTDTAGNLHWTGTHSGKHIVKAEEGE